jgi:hypothetical protein
MRMRVTKPDFWESERIANLSKFARLLLSALWSYMDDNGVQKDSAVSIAGECFRFDLVRDVDGTLKAIAAGLDEIWAADLLIRYTVGPERYLEIVDWSFWQKPDHPSKPRYPDSRSSDAVISLPSRGSPETLARDSRESPDRITEPETEQEIATQQNHYARDRLNNEPEPTAAQLAAQRPRRHR